MLADFALVSLFSKLKSKESFIVDDNVFSKLNGFQIFLIVLIIFFAILRIAASTIVAYRCNINENIIVKILICIFAFLFSEIYVPYYLIKYDILGRKCKNNYIVKQSRKNSNNNYIVKR